MAAYSDNLPAVLTVEEAATVLKIGRSAAYEAIRTGSIPHVRIGKLIRIPRAALMEWLGQGETAQAGERGAVSENKGGTGEHTTFRQL